MLSGLAGIGAALAFVLGLLFVGVRLLRAVPGLTGRTGRGPELEVLARTALSPKQGVATVRVGERVLVLGYGEGGVRAVGEVAMPVESADERIPATSDDRTRALEPGSNPSGFRWADTDAGSEADGLSHPSAPIPFREAFSRAVRSVRVLVLAAFLAGGAILGSPPPLTAASATVATTAAVTVQDAAAGSGIDLPSIDLTMDGGSGEELRLSGPVGTVLFVGFLTLLPTLLLLMTSFTRILVVLHLLKQALGTQTAPPAHLVSAMALLLTGFVMSPVLQEANTTAVRPWLDGETDELQMMKTASVPFREFMLGSVREEDLGAFMEMSNTPPVETTDDIPLVVLTTAFVTSELRAAFQMGFALFLPFVVIDVVVASVLMSMGMFMLPPVMVSLPFKLLLFVLVDGWTLVMGSLVKSFA